MPQAPRAEYHLGWGDMLNQHRKRRVKIRITPPMRQILAAARKKRTTFHHATLGLNHWVAALRELFPVLPGDAGWDDIKMMEIRTRLREGDVGPELSPEAALAEAARLAKREGLPAPSAFELVRVVLGKAHMLPRSKLLEPLEAMIDLDAGSGPNDTGGEAPAEIEPPPPLPTAASPPTPTLDRFGRDLVATSTAGVIGREGQAQLMAETLCRASKRNIALVGPPGVGKRAVVEALGARLREPSAPRALAGLRIVEIQLVAVVAGVTSFEELALRVGQIASEARNAKVVLFFDDLRAVMAAGTDGPGAAIAGQLKPDVVRGDLTIIVSGSEEDYRRITEVDPTWGPYFQAIRVDELSPHKTLEVLESIAEYASSAAGINIPAPVRRWIVDFADEFLRSHRFPGKAVDLMDQCIAYAVSRGATKVNIADAREVAERALGAPTDIHARLRGVSRALRDADLLLPEDRKVLEERLSVTLRSLDLRPDRPNAVVLLAGDVASFGHLLSETLAKGIAGSSDRVVAIDLSMLVEPWDVRHLLGAPPAKAAAQSARSLHRLIDAPWSVVLFENVDACHPHVRTMITRALEAGYFTDTSGRKIHLSDAVVVFTAPTISTDPKASLGFGEASRGQPAVGHAAPVHALGELAALIDLEITKVRTEPAEGLTRKRLFADLRKRYRTRGLEITWDPAFLAWTEAEAGSRTPDEWDEWVDHKLSAALIPHLPAKNSTKHVVVGQNGGNVIVAVSRAAKARDR